VYTTGPIWGRIVDARGPRILLCCAFIFLLSGYMGMRHLFDVGLEEGQQTLSWLGFASLIMFSYLTGAGGNGGLTSSVNSTAKTFPDEMVSPFPHDSQSHVRSKNIAEGNDDRPGHLWLWTLCLPILNDCTHILRRQYLLVLAHTRYRHSLPYGSRLLLSEAYPITLSREDRRS